MSAEDLSRSTHSQTYSSSSNLTPQRKKIDFSIDGILKVPYFSTSSIPPHIYHDDKNVNKVHQHTLVSELSNTQQQSHSEDRNVDIADSDESKDFSWLYCSRFKPPKLPRSKKRSNRKRYGRGPRIPFAAHQITVLENAFKKSHYLSPDCINRLAESLYLSETRVKIWFQNRRARFRREQEMSIPSIVSASICDSKIMEDSTQPSSLPDTSNGSLSNKTKRRRPNVSSCDDDEDDRLNFRIISSHEQLDMSPEPADLRGEIQHTLQIPTTKLAYASVSQDLLNPSCLSAMNHFNRIIHGSLSSAFVPL
ncbi:unnamed protein product, partial [Allacma fusca]